jgi:hypothetical protein
VTSVFFWTTVSKPPSMATALPTLIRLCLTNVLPAKAGVDVGEVAQGQGRRLDDHVVDGHFSPSGKAWR